MPQVTLKTHKDINRAINWFDRNATKALYSGEVVLILDRPGRTKDQNDKAWPMYRDFEPIKFNEKYWKAEDWKCFLLSAFNKEMPAVGLYGEPVSMGLSTSRLSKKRFSEFIEFIYSEGSQRGVIWSDPAMKFYQEICEHEKQKTKPKTKKVA